MSSALPSSVTCRILAAGLVAGALLAIAVPSAGAATTATVGCSTRTTATKLAAVDGDSNAYFTAPSGTFERGTSGWSLSSASVVSGNESYRVNGGGSSSLKVASGGRAVTPLFCNQNGEKGLRFFYTGTNGARVHLHIDVTNSNTGNVATLDWETSVTPGAWKASSFINVPDLYSAGYENLQLTFTAPSGSVQIDDVEIDPWKPN